MGILCESYGNPKGNSLGILLRILWEFFVNPKGNSLVILLRIL